MLLPVHHRWSASADVIIEDSGAGESETVEKHQRAVGELNV